MAPANHPAAAPPPDLRLHPSRGIVLTQGLRLVVRVGTVGILARLIVPEQYGVYGMAALVYGLASVVQDFGLGAVTMRKPVLSEDERSGFFWLNVLMGAVLALVVAGLGPIIALFYHEPVLQRLLPVLAITFLLNGLYVQLRAQLAREQQFSELNRIEIAAFLLSSVAAVITAKLGAGVWALVMLPLVSEATMAIGIWRAQHWRPHTWARRFSPWGAFSLGAGISGHEVLRYLQRNTDQFFISRWLGPSSLGLYGRAIQLVTLPGQYLIDPLSGWVIATLGGLHDSPATARIFWCRVANGLAHLTVPFAVVIFCLPSEVLRLFFGPAWISGAPMLRGLAGLLLAQPMLTVEAWLLIATGRNHRLLAWSGATLLAMIAGCGLALSFGAAAIAATLSLILLLAAAAGALFALRGLPAQANDFIKSVGRPLVLGLVSVLAIFGLFNYVHFEGAAFRLGVGAFVIFTCWSAGWLWPGARGEYRNHFLFLRK